MLGETLDAMRSAMRSRSVSVMCARSLPGETGEIGARALLSAIVPGCYQLVGRGA